MTCSIYDRIKYALKSDDIAEALEYLEVRLNKEKHKASLGVLGRLEAELRWPKNENVGEHALEAYFAKIFEVINYRQLDDYHTIKIIEVIIDRLPEEMMVPKTLHLDFPACKNLEVLQEELRKKVWVMDKVRKTNTEFRSNAIDSKNNTHALNPHLAQDALINV